tara:strand:- start:17525 stop:17872 length:348 start_codon:yes stop_codon:yes gene_type:complete
MAEDILADLMGSFLIVAPAVFGMLFAYWLFKKVRGRTAPTSKIETTRQRGQSQSNCDIDERVTAIIILATHSPPHSTNRLLKSPFSVKPVRMTKLYFVAWNARMNPGARLIRTKS